MGPWSGIILVSNKKTKYEKHCKKDRIQQKSE